MKKIITFFESLILCVVLIVGSFVNCTTTAFAASSGNDIIWNRVPFGVGGYITGIISHPLEQNLRYIKTDIGGAYRWENKMQEWVPIIKDTENYNLYGVHSLALDPNNVNIIYACLGKNWWLAGGVYKSVDRGETWTKILDKKFWSNGSYKRYGECIAVDPANSQHLIVGTPYEGAYESLNGGTSWSKIADLPTVTDRTAPITSVIMTSGGYYAAVLGRGIYKCSYGSKNWQLMANTLTTVIKMQVYNDILYACDISGIYKYQNENFTKLTASVPISQYYNFTVSGSYIAVVGISSSTGDIMKMPVYYSADAGVTWKNSMAKNTHTSTVGWIPQEYFSSYTSCLEFDPYCAKALWFTDLDGLWMTDDITAETTEWTNRIYGIEETTAFDLVSFPQGPKLISGLADQTGAYYDDSFTYPSARLTLTPKLMSITSIDFCEENPNLAVICGLHHGSKTGEGGYSTDGGKTWKAFASWPKDLNGSKLKGGRIAIGSSYQNNVFPTILMATIENGVYSSSDCGNTWKAVSGYNNVCSAYWSRNQVIDSDKSRANVFYMLSAGKLYKTLDNCSTWSSVANTSITSFKSDFSQSGALWGVDSAEKLYYSDNGGVTFTEIPGITEVGVNSFDLGKPLVENGPASIFFYGKLNGTRGLYRSYDRGASWKKIDKNEWFFGNRAVVVAGDRQSTGSAYISTDGSGTFYGEQSDGRTYSENFNNVSNTTLPEQLSAWTGEEYSGVRQLVLTNRVLDFSQQAKGDKTNGIYSPVSASIYNRVTPITGSSFKLSAIVSNRLSSEDKYAAICFNISENKDSYYEVRLNGNKQISVHKCENETDVQLGGTIAAASLTSNIEVQYDSGQLTVISGGNTMTTTDSTPLTGGYFGMSVLGSGYFDDFDFENINDSLNDSPYENNFDSVPNNWTFSNSYALVSSGQLLFENASYSSTAIFDGQKWSGGNFVADFSVKVLSNRIRYYFNYSLNINRQINTYALDFDLSSKKITLYKIVNGSEADLVKKVAETSTAEILATKSDVSEISTTGNRAKVCFYNGKIKVYMGNRSILSYTDENYIRGGKMGFGANYGYGRIDNFKVSVPDENMADVDDIKLIGKVNDTLNQNDWISDSYVNNGIFDQTMTISKDANCTMTYVPRSTKGSYKAEIGLKNSTGQTGTVYIRFNTQNEKNYYCLSFDCGGTTPKAILTKSIDGLETILAQSDWQPDEDIQNIRIEYEKGGNISAYRVRDSSTSPIFKDIHDADLGGGYTGIGTRGAETQVMGLTLEEEEIMIFAEEKTQTGVSFRALSNTTPKKCDFIAASYENNQIKGVSILSQEISTLYNINSEPYTISMDIKDLEIKLFTWGLQTLIPMKNVCEII